jgi:Predicted Zn-dependent peptidases
MTALTEALPQGMRALAEAALHPGWDAKRFTVLRADAVAAARKSLENPGVQAARLTVHTLYPHHGYGHRPDGDDKSLARIRLKDLQDLYGQQFRPQGAVLAISGDITLKAALKLLRPLFSNWKGKPAEALRDVPEPKPVRGRKRMHSMPTRQMTIQLARLGPSRYDPDFFAAMLMNHILGGGGFASRLMNEVREKRGLVYGVYSYFLPLAAPGPFVISLRTRADQGGQALKVVRRVMARMAHGMITKKELAAAKANLIGGFAHRLDSNAKRVGLLSMIGFYDLPLDYLATWKSHVGAVTLQAVKAVAARYLKPTDWNVIEVGPISSRHTRG